MRQVVARINEMMNKMSKRQEFLLISILSVGYVFGILLWMGTMTCGWHLTDDHEFLVMVYGARTEGKSFWDMCKVLTKEDLFNRFRPLYTPARVFSVFMFGENLLPYYIMKALEVIASCIILYYAGRQMSQSKIASVLFALVSLTGYQSAAWWKLGTHEMQGTLLFAIAWLSLMLWIKNEKKVWAIVSVISAVPMMLYKESYLVMAPFLMIFVIYFDHYVNQIEFSIQNILKTIKKRWKYLITIGIFFALFAGYFAFVVGLTSYDMSRGDSVGTLQAYWNGLTDSLVQNLKWYFRFSILFIAIMLTYWEDLKKRWIEFVVICVFILPQIAIYGKVGFSGHYLLPLTIAIALFFVLWSWDWNALSGKRRWVYVAGVLLMLLANGRVALREADYFRLRGEGITTALETIQDLSSQKEDIKVLSTFNTNEEANTTFQYWLLNRGIDNMYYWHEDTKTIDSEYDGALIVRDDTGTYTIDDMDIVVSHNQEDRHWCYYPTIDLSEFTEIPCGTLTIYVRSDVELEVPQIQITGLKINF